MRPLVILLLFGFSCAGAALIYPNCDENEFFNTQSRRCTECSICGDHLYVIDECTPRKNTVCGWCGNKNAEKNLDYIAKCEKYNQNPYNFYGYMRSELEKFDGPAEDLLAKLEAELLEEDDERELPPLPEDADDVQDDFEDDEETADNEDNEEKEDTEDREEEDENEILSKPLLDAKEFEDLPKLPQWSEEMEAPEEVRREFDIDDKLRRDKVLFVRNREYESEEIEEAIQELNAAKLPFLPQEIDEEDIDGDNSQSSEEVEKSKKTVVESAEEVESVGWVVIRVEDDAEQKMNLEESFKSYNEIERELQDRVNSAATRNTYNLLKRVFWFTLWFLIFFLLFVKLIRKCSGRKTQPRYDDLQSQLNNDMIDRCAAQMRANGGKQNFAGTTQVHDIIYVRGYENPLHNPVQDV